MAAPEIIGYILQQISESDNAIVIKAFGTLLGLAIEDILLKKEKVTPTQLQNFNQNLINYLTTGATTTAGATTTTASDNLLISFTPQQINDILSSENYYNFYTEIQKLYLNPLSSPYAGTEELYTVLNSLITNLEPNLPKPTYVPPTGSVSVNTNDDNILDILSPAVGAAFGVYTNAILATRYLKPISNSGLVLSAGAGSIIGTTLNTLSNDEPVKLFSVDNIIGAIGAGVGCAAGQYIVYDNVSTPGPIVSQSTRPILSQSTRPILLIGGFAALGAGAAIAIEQYVTQSASGGAYL
jgi:hypothetical protein